MDKVKNDKLLHYLKMRQQLAAKRKEYDLSKIKKTIMENIVYEKFKIKRLLLFGISGEVNVENKLIITMNQQTFLAFSIDDDCYISSEEFFREDQGHAVLAFYDCLPKDVILPDKWVLFWQVHFEKYLSKDKYLNSNLDDLVDYLCISLRKLIGLNPYEEKTERNTMLYCYEFEQTNRNRLMLGEKVWTDIEVDIEEIIKKNGDNEYSELFFSSNDIKSSCHPYIDWSDQIIKKISTNTVNRDSFNVIIEIKDHIMLKDFYSHFLIYGILHTAYQCESLFMPGENVAKDVLDINMLRAFVSNSMRYDIITEQEYEQILFYIIKKTSKNLINLLN